MELLYLLERSDYMDCAKILNNVKSIIKLYDEMSEDVCRELSISKIEMDILAFLTNNKDFDTASSIVEMRMIPKANVSQGVELLIKKGFLIRRPDTGDRRKIHLSVTLAAKTTVERILNMQEAFSKIIFDGFSEDEKESFSSFNSRIAQNSVNKIKELKNGKK